MGIIISNGARQAVGVKPAPAAGCGWEAVPGVCRVTCASCGWETSPGTCRGHGRNGERQPRSNRADRGPLAGPLANRDMHAAAARCTGALRRAAAALPGGRLPPRRAGATATQGCRRAARPCRGGLRLFDQVLRLRGRCCACSSLRML